MNNQKAFTLIELLVVVLIIGILAAVGVPQYQFAVDKTRAMTHFQNAQAIIKAEQVYKMANGNYTSDLTALDVDVTKTCTSMQGNCGNELANCSGNFSYQIPNVNCIPTTNVLNIRYCTSDATSCYSATSTSKHHFVLVLSLIDGAVQSCGHYTSRGQKLCNYFSQQFSTSN